MSTVEERERQAAIIKRNRKVPYKDLDRARECGERAFPDAVEVRALLYGGAPYIEVWRKDGTADIRYVDLDSGEILAARAAQPKRR